MINELLELVCAKEQSSFHLWINCLVNQTEVDLWHCSLCALINRSPSGKLVGLFWPVLFINTNDAEAVRQEKNMRICFVVRDTKLSRLMEFDGCTSVQKSEKDFCESATFCRSAPGFVCLRCAVWGLRKHHLHIGKFQDSSSKASVWDSLKILAHSHVYVAFL